MSSVEFSSLRLLQANLFAALLGRSLTSSGSAFLSRVSAIAVPIRPLTLGCAETGTRIYHGEFSFAGKSVFCRGAPIFDALAPNKAWLENLHGFAWLADLQATGLELARVNARALVSDWLDRDRYHPKAARSPSTICRRLISWIIAAPFLMEHAGEDFLSRFCLGLARHVRDLQLRSALCLSPVKRVDCAIALAYAAIALKGMEAARAPALELLADGLDQQILPDGGHISRNPAELARLLQDLLPLRLACESSRTEFPVKLQAAIERMLPMLRFFLHADGGLAIFQGAADPLVAECAAIVQADSTQGMPLSNAVYSRFMRLSQGGTVIICDTGFPTGSSNSTNAFSPLAFEFSDGVSRLVINCGAPVLKGGFSEVARLPEAHSTATLITRSRQAPLPLPAFLRSRRKGPRAEACFGTTSSGSLIEARHGGYEQTAGLIHERRLFLSAAGTDFRGEDCFVPTTGANAGDSRFLIRFHLHPEVQATPSGDGTCLALHVPDKTSWTFKARGAECVLEESICLWGKAGPRRTLQILLSGQVGPSAVNWAFKRAHHVTSHVPS